MSKYVECQLSITYEEFRQACLELGMQIGTMVRMYRGQYEVEISADDVVGLIGSKIIFDDMIGGKTASRIIENIYTSRLRNRFGELDISRSETSDSIVLRVRR